MSIEINVMPRQSGKTTKVIEMMEKDRELILIVPYATMKKLYPSNLHHRIVAGGNIEFKFGRHRATKIIIDEGFMFSSAGMAKLYYELGRSGMDVIVYGTEKHLQ